MKSILAGAVLLFASGAAFAVDMPLANGSFEVDPAQGFSQTFTNWTASFAGSVPASMAGPPPEYSGLWTFFGTKYPPSSVPNGSAFMMLANLGAGTVTLQSNAATLALPTATNFAVIDRNLQFRYVYLTNEPAGSAQDRFFVRVDFFASATSSIVTSSILTQVIPQSYKTDSGIGFSPFSGANNNASLVFNDSVGSGGSSVFNLFNVDISSGFGQFARVSFIVDNNNPLQNQSNGNGLGVSGVLLDQVLLNPEPSAMALFALGAMGLGGFAWRKRAAAKKPAA